MLADSMLFKLFVFPGTVFSLIIVLFLFWWWRKIGAAIQGRYGPKHVGPSGTLQTIADVLKLITKESIVPEPASRWFWFMPVFSFALSFLFLSLIPFSDHWMIIDFDTSLIMLFAVMAIEPLLIFLVGWASYNKYGVAGGERAGIQMLGYEVFLALTFVPVIMMSHSWSLVGIVYAQGVSPTWATPIAHTFVNRGVWFGLVQPLALALSIIAVMMATEKKPFNIPHAEPEVLYGSSTEYGGPFYALQMLSQFLMGFLGAGLITTLYLGGWSLPFVPSAIGFVLKTLVVGTIIIWLEHSLPTMRIPQFLSVAWRKLVPLAFLNIFITLIIMEVLGWA